MFDVSYESLRSRKVEAHVVAYSAIFFCEELCNLLALYVWTFSKDIDDGLLICAKALHCSPECHAIICCTESRGRGHSGPWLKDRNSWYQFSADNHYYLTKEFPVWLLTFYAIYLTTGVTHLLSILKEIKEAYKINMLSYIYIVYNK